MRTHHQRMIASGNKHGAVANQPSAVSKYVMRTFRKSNWILDMGAGLTLCQYKLLRRAGYRKVHASDLPVVEAAWPGQTSRRRYWAPYDVVMLSNVLNVQACRRDIVEVLDSALYAAMPKGVIVCNYPQSPRYAGLTYQEVVNEIRDAFPAYTVTTHQAYVITIERAMP